MVFPLVSLAAAACPSLCLVGEAAFAKLILSFLFASVEKTPEEAAAEDGNSWRIY